VECHIGFVQYKPEKEIVESVIMENILFKHSLLKILIIVLNYKTRKLAVFCIFLSISFSEFRLDLPVHVDIDFNIIIG